MPEDDRMNPYEFLKSISHLLGQEGDIKSPQEVVRIISLMKETKKLVGRCCYLNILRATKSEETLSKFIDIGGWGIMNSWLTDAKDTNNVPLLQEVLKVLKHMPVTIEQLKKNNTAKVVKQLSKSSDNEKTKSMASSLVTYWMNMIHAKGKGGSEKPNKKHKRHHEDSKESEKTEKTVAEPEKPKKARSTKVKAPAFAKTRSTGLEEETKLPAPIKKSGSIEKRPGSSIPTAKRPSSPIDKLLTPPEKKHRPQPLNRTNNSPVQAKVKIIPAKPFVAMDDTGFMEALSANTAKSHVIKVKKKPKNAKPGTPTSPTAPKGNPLSADDKDRPRTPSPVDGVGEVKEERPGTPIEEAMDGDFSKPTKAEEAERKADEELEPPEPYRGGSILVSARRKNRRKKSVKWAVEDALKEVYYFEMDESERANVNVQNFQEAAHREMMLERRAMETAKRLSADEMMEKKGWRPPVRLDLPPGGVDPGCQSLQRDIQKEREQCVLQELFFSKSSLPDSPHEPDPEPYTREEPKVIPLDEEMVPEVEFFEPPPFQPTAEEEDLKQHHQQQQQQMPLDQGLLNPPPGVNLPPALANLIGSMQKKPTPTSQAQPPPQTSQANPGFNLLSSIMGGEHPAGEQNPTQDPELLTTQLKDILNKVQGGPAGMGPPGGPQGPGGMHPIPMEGQPGPMGNGMPRGGPFDHQGPMGPGGPPMGPGPFPGGQNGPPQMEMPFGPDQGHPPFQGPPNRGPPPMMHPPGPGPQWPRGPPRGPMRGRPFQGRGRGRGRGDRSHMPVCRHFMSPTGCRFEGSCTFYHPGVNGPPLPH